MKALVSKGAAPEAEARLAMFKALDHPSDLRAQIWGASPQALVASGIEAVWHFMLGELPGGRETRLEMDGEAFDLEESLVRVLNEIIFQVTVESMAFVALESFSFQGTRFFAVLLGDPLPQETQFHHEVKAATYAGLEVIMSEDGGLETAIIFDV